MENICQDYSTNKEKDFINEELIINREKFFTEFLDEDELVKYILKGLGNDLVLSRKELETLIHNSRIKFEIVTDEACIGIISNMPFIIEYY